MVLLLVLVLVLVQVVLLLTSTVLLRSLTTKVLAIARTLTSLLAPQIALPWLDARSFRQASAGCYHLMLPH